MEQLVQDGLEDRPIVRDRRANPGERPAGFRRQS